MTALWLIVLCGALSIVYAIWATQSVLNADAGNARMQAFGEAFYGRTAAYDLALTDSEEALAQSFCKNILNGQNIDKARELAAYANEAIAVLARADLAALTKGAWQFPVPQAAGSAACRHQWRRQQGRLERFQAKWIPGSREESAPTRIRSPVPIQSERKRFWVLKPEERAFGQGAGCVPYHQRGRRRSRHPPARVAILGDAVRPDQADEA